MLLFAVNAIDLKLQEAASNKLWLLLLKETFEETFEVTISGHWFYII